MRQVNTELRSHCLYYTEENEVMWIIDMQVIICKKGG